MPTKLKKNLTLERPNSDLAKLLIDQPGALAIPEVGQTVTGTVIESSKRQVLLDLAGYGVGVVRGPALYLEAEEYAALKPGDTVEATVLEGENENGEVELSFRTAGHQRVWGALEDLAKAGTILDVDILEANRGGLMVRVNKIPGFLPVSQLSPEHYPRVPGGDKAKILEKLKTYVGKKMPAKVITVDPEDEKLIVSEKAAWEETQSSTLAKYQIGDVIEGKVTAVTDFGAFVEFGEKLEGLVHISELAWQRVEHPKDVVVVGQEVKAKIINLQGSKIFLSMKALIADPWQAVAERYQVGQLVKGKVLKLNPFGLFVELDPDIHGLAHVSELSAKPVDDVSTVAKPGEVKEFRIVSIEPEQHRLGLSLKAVKDWKEGGEITATKTKEEAAPVAAPAEGEAQPAADTTELSAAEVTE